MRRADGNLIWISLTVNAMRDTSGMITAHRTIITDVTQRKTMEDELRKKNAELGAAFEELTVIEEELRQNYGELGKSEQALRRSEERYRNVIEDQTEFICRFLPDGTHVFINEAYCRYFGLKRDEIIGHRFRPKIPADDRERVRRFFVSLTQDNPIDSIEHRIIMLDGSIRWQAWSDRAIFDLSGTIIEYQSVGRDITARYLSEEYLARISTLKQELLGAAPLEEKLKRITDFLVELFGVDFARIWISGMGDLCDNGCIHAPVTEGPHVCRNRASCLHLVASSGRYTHTDGGHRRVPFGAYKIGRIASGVEALFVTNDVTHDPRVHDHEWAASLGLVSFAGFRLVSAERETIGVLAFFSRQLISPEITGFLQDIATTASQVVRTGMVDLALRESEEKYRAFFTTSRDCVFITSREGIWIDFNDAALDIFGYESREELQQINIKLLYADPQERNRHLAIISEKGYSKEYPVNLKKKDGTIIKTVITAVPRKDRDGTINGFQGTIRDITDQKHAEEELRTSEERYRSLFECVPIGLYRTTPSGQILDVNPALVRLLGYPDRESLRSVSVIDLYRNPEDRNQWLALVEREGIVLDLEVQFRKYNGTIIWVRDTGEAVRDDSNQVIYYNGNIEDITERKRPEENLQRKNEELAAMNEEIRVSNEAAGSSLRRNCGAILTN